MKLEQINSAAEAERNRIFTLGQELSTCKTRLEIFKTTMDSVSNGGINTRKIAEKIDEESERLVEIEKQIAETKAKLSAYEDLAKIFPKQENFKLREGSEVASIEKFIRSKGRQVSLDDIVSSVARAGDDPLKKKKSLRGTLRAYVRDSKVFADGTEPDTYTLIEFKRLDAKAISN